MTGRLGELWAHVLPPDSGEGRVVMYQWRRNVALVILGLLAFVAWASSPVGFATEHSVSQKIAAQIAPLSGQMSEQGRVIAAIRSAQTETTADNKELILELLAGKIRVLARERCAEQSNRERLNADIHSLQRQYEKRAGNQYVIPKSCTEL